MEFCPYIKYHGGLRPQASELTACAADLTQRMGFALSRLSPTLRAVTRPVQKRHTGSSPMKNHPLLQHARRSSRRSLADRSGRGPAASAVAELRLVGGRKPGSFPEGQRRIAGCHLAELRAALKCKQSRSLRSRPAGCLAAPSEAARLGGRCWVGPARRAARPVPARLVCRAVLRAKVVRGPCLARGPGWAADCGGPGGRARFAARLAPSGGLLLAAPRRLFGPSGAPLPPDPRARCARRSPRRRGPIRGAGGVRPPAPFPGLGALPAARVSRAPGPRRFGLFRCFWPFFVSLLPFFAFSLTARFPRAILTLVLAPSAIHFFGESALLVAARFFFPSSCVHPRGFARTGAGSPSVRDSHLRAPLPFSGIQGKSRKNAARHSPPCVPPGSSGAARAD